MESFLRLGLRSDLGHAAVDEQLDAGDVAAVVRRQEQRGLRDLVRVAHPTQRNRPDHVLLELLDLLLAQPQAVEARRVDRTRADRVDADLAGLEIDRPAPRERPHRRLGRAVHAEALEALGAGDRRVQDDRPAVPEERQRLLHGEEQTLDVAAERRVEVLLGDRAQRRERAAAVIGEADVEPAFLSPHRLVQTVQVRELRHVALNAGGPLADLLHRGVELVRAAAGDEDVRAFLREPARGREADAAVATRDDGDFPFESIHERHSFLAASAALGFSRATLTPSFSPSGGLTTSRSCPLRPETISTDCPRSRPNWTPRSFPVPSPCTATTWEPAARVTIAVAGTTHTSSDGGTLNLTCAYMPGISARSSLRRRPSVSSVRDVGSRAPAVLAMVPTNVRCGNSGTRTFASWPGVIERTNVCGTLTKMRRLSMRAIRKSGLAPLPLPEVMRAPRSMPRIVMIPAKGASSRWKDCRAARRWTL